MRYSITFLRGRSDTNIKVYFHHFKLLKSHFFNSSIVSRSFSVTAFLDPGSPSDGGWSEWGEWTECDKWCGTGHHVRERTCSNPTPENGGKDCEGAHEETESCKLIDCRK